MKTRILTTVAMLLILAITASAQMLTGRKLAVSRICSQIDVWHDADEKYQFANKKNNELFLIERQWEQYLWEASGADPEKDTDAEAKVKIQDLWNKHKLEMTCNGGVSFIKYAVERDRTEVIVKAVDDYELDLNYTDILDNRTVLDHFDEVVDRHTSRAFLGDRDYSYAKKMTDIRDFLAKHGVKSVLELKKRSEWTADLYAYSGKMKFDKFKLFRNNGDDFERNYQTIVAEFNKAIEMEPKNLSLYYQRAILNLFGKKDDTSRLTSALADIDRFLKERKRLSGSEVGANYVDRAEANCRLGNKTAALADEKKAVELGIGTAKYGKEELPDEGIIKSCQYR